MMSDQNTKQHLHLSLPIFQTLQHIASSKLCISSFSVFEWVPSPLLDWIPGIQQLSYQIGWSNSGPWYFRSKAVSLSVLWVSHFRNIFIWELYSLVLFELLLLLFFQIKLFQDQAN